MKRAKQKLHSRSGATILLALLLFLVAAMVCAVIVSASFTTAKRVHDDKSEEQDYLTVSSAAKLLKKSLLSSSVTYTTTTLVTDGVPAAPQTVPTAAGPRGEALRAAIESPGAYALTVTPGDTQLGAAVMNDFTVVKRADGNDADSYYKLSGTLSPAGGRADSQKIYLIGEFMMKSEQPTTQQSETLPEGVTEQYTLTQRETLQWVYIQLNTAKEAAE